MADAPTTGSSEHLHYKRSRCGVELKEDDMGAEVKTITRKGSSQEEKLYLVITSYSIHYTKLYESMTGPRGSALFLLKPP